MRTLYELIDLHEPAFPLVRQWAASAVRSVEILPPSAQRDAALLKVQVTTRSPMGAIIHDTGGILVDGGWLRILGSGHPRLTRTLPGWNVGRGEGFLLVADDAVGGFFAINGGALGGDPGGMYYFAPDSLAWEPLHVGYSEFLQWSFSEGLGAFYDWIRWQGWEDDVRTLQGDRSFSFYPFLFTAEGEGGRGSRSDVDVAESWTLSLNFASQLGAR
ncbi:DUF2625 domain-containing protein [Tahibacter amnicola]|uniref:DUF2625 domain-containing protein n=1 Tax=Tahibacter amnicola TaxID=2976241 RepID=A0ABY6BB66_9GAMM|nr:DUF2625 domain-containing protein [Tahibacter amnicola]UXI65876.1 DUF2625 domain-containing protein [Tahibacter amnicola]